MANVSISQMDKSNNSSTHMNSIFELITSF